MYVKLKNRKMEDLNNRDVLLFGASALGVRSIDEVKKYHANMIGFLDNDIRKHGKILEGYPIYSPADIIRFSNALVLITSAYDDEISAQLAGMSGIEFDVMLQGAKKDVIPDTEFFKPFLVKNEANEYLYQRLLDDSPFFIGRLGSNELECMTEYYYVLNRASGGIQSYHNNLKLVMKQGAGFFPTEDAYLDQMVKLYTEGLQNMDCIWSMWLSRFENMLYERFSPQAELTKYDDTAFPYDIENPWTRALEGKRILVIHPFEDSILENYKKRKKLHNNQMLLPEFQLLTLKSVQSLADEQPPYETWFDALHYMEKQIDTLEFDIALIGAGAYGLPLGAYCKQLGKKALHIGGMLQLLFGIKGNAWNDLGVYNEHWTSPKSSETPKSYKSVEAGRYW